MTPNSSNRSASSSCVTSDPRLLTWTFAIDSESIEKLRRERLAVSVSAKLSLRGELTRAEEEVHFVGGRAHVATAGHS